ncbi:MAG TPA: beta-ketoacyl synthase N-terminal-like domain-containing protein [Micromonosporaceae bacterium]|nr:beta-ketoacyl synthase N-terminal-like domain-containing protein [Micromonosporaceae bacterium]
MADEEKLRQYLRKATAELQQSRRQLAAAEAARHEPIAIVGIGCRFPGAVRSPEDLWRLVDSDADVISGLPVNRGWNLAGQAPDLTGGFLHDADMFDPEFFGIDETEARAMDPQQRLLLETSWEAFERAGIDPLTARNSATAVYAGLQFGGYPLLLREPPSDDLKDYLGVGNSVGAASGRVSYLMGLLGGALTVDTQCTSSLVAIHLAAKALRAGECSLALAGGAVVMSVPGTLLEFRRRGSLAPDGRSKSFAGAADGVSLGEGAGMLLLERLSDAQRHGRPILAIIRGTAINQDGATNGMASPSGRAQERVIRAALVDAGLTADAVDVVEGHGVGATLGDAVEAGAIIATYGRDRGPDRPPLLLGSVKSNIGHTQTVGAVAGIAKLVMALRHERLPRTLHVDRPTPHTDWSRGTVRLATETTPWARGNRVRRAGLSCLTISGTNAHLILEEPPAEQQAERTVPDRPMPYVLSARSAPALRDRARRLLECTDAEPTDVAYALHRTRSTFRHRAVVVARSRDELAEGLRALADDRAAPELVQGIADLAGRTAVVFPGDGPVPAAVARELYGAFPEYRAAVDEVLGALPDDLAPSVRELLFTPAVEHGPSFARLALFVSAIAHYRLLTAFGVRPHHVIGYAVGEAAAAHVAGALSLRDACTLAVALSRLTGAPASVEVHADEASVIVDGIEPAVISGVDEPGVTAVTGDTAAIELLSARWHERGWATRQAPRGYVSADDDRLEEVRRSVAGLTFSDPGVPIVSAVHGGPVNLAELRSPEHWAAHAHRPRRMLACVRQVRSESVTRLVDLGGDAAAPLRIQRSLAACGQPGESVLATAAVAPVGEAVRTLLRTLAELQTDGVGVDWTPAFTGHLPRHVDLPTYPFQSRRFWLSPPDSADRPATLPPHPLLGTPLRLAGEVGRYLGSTPSPAIARQRIHGTPVLSPGALLSWAIAAAADGGGGGGGGGGATLHDVTFPAPVAMRPGRAIALQTRIETGPDGVRIDGFVDNSGWQPCLTVARAQPAAPVDTGLTDGHPELSERAAAALHEAMWRDGTPYDPVAQTLTGLHVDGTIATGMVTVGDSVTVAADAELFDGVLQVAWAFGSGPRLMRSVERFTVHAPLPSDVLVRAHRRADEAVDLAVYAGSGTLLASVHGLRLAPIDADQVDRLAAARPLTCALGWQALPAVAPTATVGASPGRWLVVSTVPEQAARWREDLRAAGLAATALGPADRAGLRNVADVAGLVLHDPLDTGDGGAELVRRAVPIVTEFLEALPRSTVVVCSTGATAPGPDLARPAQTVLTALAKTAMWEYPDATCAQVDLDPDATAPALDLILGRVAQLAGSGHLAVRSGRWYRAELRPVEPHIGEGVKLAADATYLVVGGPAEQAALTACWLTARGAEAVLVIRPPGTAMPAGEPGVEFRAADPADPDQVNRLLAERAELGRPVRGVIHLAAPLPHRRLAAAQAADLADDVERAVRPVRLLARQTTDLDFFVAAGDAVSVPGFPGTFTRTAADAVLGSLLGGPSLAWGPWSPTGARAELTARGVHPTAAEVALTGLETALSGLSASVARIDWTRFLATAQRSVPYAPLATATGGIGDDHVPGFGQNRMNQFRNRAAAPRSS